MNMLSLIVRELVGMFIDDEFLAVAALGVVALAALSNYGFAVPHLLTGAILLVGVVGVLIWSVLRGARRRSDT